MAAISPYQNESESVSLGGLTIENRTDRVEIYGSLNLTRAKFGLSDALAWKEVLDAIVQILSADKNLPQQVRLTNKPRPANNPFG